MRTKNLFLLLFTSALLAACSAFPIALPTTVTQASSNATPTTVTTVTHPYPAQGESMMKPTPVMGTPTPGSSPYPAPGSNGSSVPVIPPSGYEPQAGDNHMIRDPVTLDLATSQLVVTDSQPVEVKAILHGNLLDAKHILRVKVTPADAQNVINLDVYSVVPPGILSSLVEQPFSAEIPLGIYTSGTYTVMVNGAELGQFTAGYAPQAGDKLLTRGEVMLDVGASELVSSGTTPNQEVVTLSGDLPDPCHQLRIQVSPPDGQNRIDIMVYSVFDPQMMCITVIKPFEVSVPLDNLKSGHYSVYVNGNLLGEFTR